MGIYDSRFMLIAAGLMFNLGLAIAFAEPPPTKKSAPLGSPPSTASAVPALAGGGSEEPGRVSDRESLTTAVTGGASPQLRVFEKLANTVSNDYIIGAEDVLEISVWRNQDLSKAVQVRPDGKVSLPIIRDVSAVGKTPTQLADEITVKLKDYVQNPVVAIALREVNSYSVFILGEVVRPGKYPLKSRTTLLQGITIAGGFTPTAARNQVAVFRVGQNGTDEQVLNASYDDIVLRGGVHQNFELKAGDTIVVPSEAMVVLPGR